MVKSRGDGVCMGGIPPTITGTFKSFPVGTVEGPDLTNQRLPPWVSPPSSPEKASLVSPSALG